MTNAARGLRERFWSRTGLWRIGRGALVVVAIALFINAGYHAVYHLLLVGTGIEDLDVERDERVVEPFRFDGVKWFRGIVVAAEAEPVSLRLHTLPVIDRAQPEIEVFVKLDAPPAPDDALLVQLTRWYQYKEYRKIWQSVF